MKKYFYIVTFILVSNFSIVSACIENERRISLSNIYKPEVFSWAIVTIFFIGVLISEAIKSIKKNKADKKMVIISLFVVLLGGTMLLYGLQETASYSIMPLYPKSY